jgi:NADH-quinone oxidoreductase subunit G
VNGWFICDRGRFGNAAVNDPARPRTPLVDGREATWDEALDDLVIRINEVQEIHGLDSVVLVGSPRMTVEGNLMVQQLATLLGTGSVCYFAGQAEHERCHAAISGRHDSAACRDDLEKAGCIAIVDTDILEEGPMAALAVRQAWQRGAPVFLVGPHAPLSQTAAISIEAVQVDYPEEVPFGIFDNPMIICGMQHNGPDTLHTLMSSGIKTTPLLSGPNAYGSALLARETGALSLDKTLESGRIKGIICFEADIPAELPPGVTLLGAADWLATDTVRRAGIVLPSTAWVEMDGTFVNCAGRAQRFLQVMQPGIPIRGGDPDRHPPRTHRRSTPGGDALPTWRIIANMIEKLGGERIDNPLQGNWKHLWDLSADSAGTCIASTESHDTPEEHS